VPSFSKAVSIRSNRWHPDQAFPSGFLFREEDGIASALNDWMAINAADYSIENPGENRLESRGKLVLVEKMSIAMRTCIEDAVDLFMSDRERYLNFIISGTAYITSNFSWDKSAQKYVERIMD